MWNVKLVYISFKILSNDRGHINEFMNRFTEEIIKSNITCVGV